jgi:hypothetical protein
MDRIVNGQFRRTNLELHENSRLLFTETFLFYDTFVTTLIQNQMILADVLKIIDLLANKFR